MKSSDQFLRSRQNRQRGGALIELAIIVSMLALVTIGAIDFGRIGYHSMALTNAARAGAIHGAQPGNSTDAAGMQSAASNSAFADIGALTTSASRSCECQVGAATPTVMTDCPPPGNPVCVGTVRMRVTVTASKTFTMLTTLPGIQRTVTVSRTAVLRAQ